jgi:general secretion pathway protein G
VEGVVPAKCQKLLHREGFTLVEILLVVIIIGILAAIVVPRLAGKTQRARMGAAKMTIQSVATSLESFELDLGRYPTTEEGIEALIVRPSGLATEDEWHGPYLKELPLDAWNRPLIYKFPSDRGVDYDLVSVGPDGQEGTEDDVRNVRSGQQRQ